MTTPNMSSIAALERSLQNCSLSLSTNEDGVGVDRPATSSPYGNLTSSDATLELNSDVALPYQWEQCLDLETGEIYYINRQNGKKAREDPRKKKPNLCGVDYYFGEEGEGNSYYDNYNSSSSSFSSFSSGASSPCSLSTRGEREDFREDVDHVLVVAGCKSCLMYFMLPKRVIECPKCKGFLLHLDQSEKGTSL